MAVTRERFEQGLTYDQFKAHMTRNQERFEENERQLRCRAQCVCSCWPRTGAAT